MKTKTKDVKLYLEFLNNMFGDINNDIKKRLLTYLERPNYENWENTHCIIIMDGHRTVWQTILEVDPTFPRVGRSTNELGKVLRDWDRIPDRELFIKALKYAAEKNSGIKFK